MKISNRYAFGLCMAAAFIVVPVGFVRAFGASIQILAPLALIQIFSVMAFFVTSLVSLAFGIRAAFERKWSAFRSYLGAAAIPFGTWWLAALVNDPGWQAVMGI